MTTRNAYNNKATAGATAAARAERQQQEQCAVFPKGEQRFGAFIRDEASDVGIEFSVKEGVAMQCTHLNHVHKVKPSAKGCEDCLKIGGWWVHLRMCMECGHMGCCDSSPNKHATKHFHATKHPIIRSMEPGEDWGWCYIDELEVDEKWPS